MLVTGRQRAALAAAKSTLSCIVGSLIAWNVHVTGNPAEFDYFASFNKACVVTQERINTGIKVKFSAKEHVQSRMQN